MLLFSCICCCWFPSTFLCDGLSLLIQGLGTYWHRVHICVILLSMPEMARRRHFLLWTERGLYLTHVVQVPTCGYLIDVDTFILVNILFVCFLAHLFLWHHVASLNGISLVICIANLGYHWLYPTLDWEIISSNMSLSVLRRWVIILMNYHEWSTRNRLRLKNIKTNFQLQYCIQIVDWQALVSTMCSCVKWCALGW